MAVWLDSVVYHLRPIGLMTDGDVDMLADPGILPTSDSNSSTLNLRDDEWDTLSESLNMYSKYGSWLEIFEKVTDETWCGLLVVVLCALTFELGTSSAKIEVIEPLSVKKANDMVQGFNEDISEFWKI